ncbi:retrovirus-related pol polyprotein from transposon TNT 1-94 [Tanacetum coccineum]
MSAQQDIYAAGLENRPLILNKDNYIPWSSRLLRYAKRKSNAKFLTDDELTAQEAKQVQADDQAIHIILIGLPEDIYDVVDGCNSANEIWLRVQKTMKGMDISVQEKEARLLNELDKFTSVDGETVKSNIIISQRQNQSIQNVGNQNGLIVVPVVGNHNGNVVTAMIEQNGNGKNANHIRCYSCRGVGHYARNCTTRPRRRDYAYFQNQLFISQKEEAGLQLNTEEYDLMNVVADCEEEEEIHANYILMANLQQASTSGTHVNTTPIYDLDDSAELHQYENYYNNEIFNMFDQEGQYTELLKLINETYPEQQTVDNIISEASAMDPSGGEVEQHLVTIEETRSFYESLYNNLVIEVEKVNTINREIREVNEKLTAKLARYKGQEKPQLGDLKGKSTDTQTSSKSFDSNSQKLEDENVSLEFQALSLEKTNEHLNLVYHNLFDSIKQTRAQTILKTDSLQEKLNDELSENAKLRA